MNDLECKNPFFELLTCGKGLNYYRNIYNIPNYMKFDDLYVNDPRNISNLKDLTDSFAKDLFVPFIGAGPSTTLGEPNWSDLFDQLCKALNVKNVRKSKLSNGTVDYPKTFSRLFNKNLDKNRFYEKLFEVIEPKKTSATWFHKRLVQVFDSYITTNYDSPIEEAFIDVHPKRNLKKQYFSCYGLNNISNCIVYLHGHKDINFCIIKSDDYDYFYPSISKKPGIPIVEDFLTKVFTERSVIFIGFSFKDKYIEEFLRSLNLSTQLRYSHYWIISESAEIYKEIDEKVKKHMKRGENFEADNELNNFYNGKMNIKPIVYKDKWDIFPQRLFEKLVETNPVAIKPGVISAMPESSL
ncbi:MAG TPA: hypothetical protein ENH01_03980 [Nitrospirae bacterium]|nr:hypothetical protein [Nitrospirota bacterium]